MIGSTRTLADLENNNKMCKHMDTAIEESTDPCPTPGDFVSYRQPAEPSRQGTAAHNQSFAKMKLSILFRAVVFVVKSHFSKRPRNLRKNALDRTFRAPFQFLFVEYKSTNSNKDPVHSTRFSEILVCCLLWLLFVISLQC